MLSSSVKFLARRIGLIENVRRVSISSVWRTKEGSSDGHDDRKENAKQKLDSLLQSIINDESLAKKAEVKESTGLRPQLRQTRTKEKKAQNLGEQIVNAAKDVAQNIEGDQNENEAKLLHKVVAKDEKLQKSVLSASGKATLNFLLKELSVEKENEQRSTFMKQRNRGQTKTSYSRADLMKSDKSDAIRKPFIPRDSVTEKVNVFGGKPLRIFDDKANYKTSSQLDTWNQCMEKELKLAYTQAPRNIWEQMIMWTDKGMLWKFPIDNEQGLEGEQEVSFTEHVFLEAHLEDWCPRRGPIRNFMELVCVGLSRNHWLDAQEKKDHIMWYKDYFTSKKELIKELGAGDIVESQEQSLHT